MNDELDFSEGKLLPPVHPPGWIGDSARSFIAWSGLLLVLLGAAGLARTLSLWIGAQRATAVVYWKELRVVRCYRWADPEADTVFHYQFDNAGRMTEGTVKFAGNSDRWARGDSFEIVYWTAAPTDSVPATALFSPSENPLIVYAILFVVLGGLSATVAFRARSGTAAPPAEANPIKTPPAAALDMIPEALADAAPIRSALNIQFDPPECPACRSSFAVRYSRYQPARLHPLYGPFFALGVALTLTAIGLVFWLGATLILLLADGTALQRSERGLLIAILLVTWFVPIWHLTCAWFRRVQALPRSFHIRCEKCEWSGPCRVIGAHS